MMGLREWTPEPEYHSDEHDLVESFYAPCMHRAISYDRLTGFFSSGAFLLVWGELVTFARRGGRIRIICSPRLSEADANGLVRGYAAADDKDLASNLDAELTRLMADPVLRQPALALAGLVSDGVVDVRLAQLLDSASAQTKRMFHDKVGLFTDSEGDAVGFRGSANESFLGLSRSGNVESIDAFPSWMDERDAKRVQTARSRFDALWTNGVPGVEVRPLPPDFAVKLHDLAAAVSWEEVAEELAATAVAIDRRAQGPNGRRLRPQQIDALNAWKDSSKRGILEHATGSGKTVTGITAIAEHLRDDGQALVVVPSSLLARQWESELKGGIDGVRVDVCGAGGTAWRGHLRDWLTADHGRVVVAVVATASNPEFIAQARRATNLLIVGDEVHRLGALKAQTILTIDAKYRLGLSATPARAGDPEGTAAVFNYFGGVVHRFTLADAIQAGILTPYEYRPHLVRLEEHEVAGWQELTATIRQRVARLSGREDVSPMGDAEVRRLLIQRARIAKQAARKVPVAAEIVTSGFQPGHRWLVYCDDVNQMNAVADALEGKGLRAIRYHSAMPDDKNVALEHFRLNGGVVVSIKCLDEGVDIPDSTHALILASSRNPREFIQRRGRVLRQAPGKFLAHVHDVLVIPPGKVDADTETLVWGEISRAAEFASGAVNTDARMPLEEAALDLGMDLAGLYRKLGTAGWEDDDE